LNGYLIAATAALLYAAILLAGHRLGVWKRLNISLYGPIMILKTKRGTRFIEYLARPKKFWSAYGRLSVIVTLTATAITTLFLLYLAANTGERVETPESPQGQSIELPSAGYLITGIYVVVSFAIAILIHEYAHGIQSIVGKIRLTSMGILMMVVPIGAFVEPDDKELKASTPSRRASVYAAGPAANIFFAIACFALLAGVVGPYADPVAEGAVVIDIAENSPAALYGFSTWSEVVSVEGEPVKNGTQMTLVSFAEPGEMVSVEVLFGSERRTVEVPGGVVAHRVFDGPGHDAGLEPGMIIESLDDQPINSISEFRSITENASRTQPVNISVLSYGEDPVTGSDGFFEERAIKTVNLTSKWLYYRTHYPWANREVFRNVSYMAISASALGVWTEDPEFLTEVVATPFTSDGSVGANFQRFMSLPFIGYSPVVHPATDLYAPSGVMSFVPSGLYWVLLNTLYWLFWANLVLGLTNVLPAFPFDGGYVLRDTIRGVASWWWLRLTGLDRAIGRKTATDAEVDAFMWFVSGMVILIVVYILVTGLWGRL
jgi:membrane-associated protease RseP (regulator of RpoE activity)